MQPSLGPCVDDNVHLMGRRRGTSYIVTAFDRDRLVEARARLGLKPEEAARRAGVGRKTVERIEKGEQDSTSSLPELYKALHIPAELMGRPDPEDEAIVAEFRRLRRALPKKADELIAEVRKMATRAEAAKARLDDLEKEIDAIAIGKSEPQKDSPDNGADPLNGD